MWDQRYSEPEHAYGTEPNDFLVEVADRIPVGRTLCLAEGQGRNAVFLAALGHRVTAVDLSSVGLERARALALERGVELETVHADLAHFEFEPEAWDAVVAIFCHLPPPLRATVYRSAVRSLRPGGALVFEGYSRRQLQFGTGGPKDEDLLFDLEEIRADLAGLRLDIAREVVREIHEGRFHTGEGSVVQVLGFREG